MDTSAHATPVTPVTAQAALTMTSALPVPVTPMLHALTPTVVTSAPVTTVSGNFHFKISYTGSVEIHRICTDREILKTSSYSHNVLPISKIKALCLKKIDCFDFLQ